MVGDPPVSDEVVAALADGDMADEGDLIQRLEAFQDVMLIAQELLIWRTLGEKVVGIIKPDAPLRWYRNDAVRDAIYAMLPEGRKATEPPQRRSKEFLLGCILSSLKKAAHEPGDLDATAAELYDIFVGPGPEPEEGSDPTKDLYTIMEGALKRAFIRGWSGGVQNMMADDLSRDEAWQQFMDEWRKKS